MSNISLPVPIRQRIRTNTVLHIRRKLTGMGTITITPGTVVSPQDILGQGELSSGFFTLNIAKKLGVNPKKAPQYFKKNLGEIIYQGELLAFKKDLFSKKVIVATNDGIIEQYNPENGEIRFRYLPRHIPLISGVFGIVDHVDQITNTVLIRTLAHSVCGMFGFGEERSGILSILGDRTSLIQPNQISSDYNRHVIVTGALIYKQALQKAVSIGVSGIVSGGLNLSDYDAVVGSFDVEGRMRNDVGFSAMATEGFGPLSIGTDFFELIKKYDGNFVFINGNRSELILPSGDRDSILSVRKTVLPIKDQSLSTEYKVGELSVGDRVRIIWPPMMGSQGEVIALDRSVTLLESGIATYMVMVETGDHKVKVPYNNLEIIV